MSEFKFACPVCGQHITADSTTSGGQVECPTCFRKIVVPQAPASPDSKLILSAAQVDQRRLANPEPTRPLKRGPRHPAISNGVVALLILLITGSVITWLLRSRLYYAHPEPTLPTQLTNVPGGVPEKWTTDLAAATFPESKVTGRIIGVKFNCEKTTLQGGALSFYQNPGLPSERRVMISLFTHRPEMLSGVSFNVPHERTGPRPKLVLQIKHANESPTERTVEKNYALKMAFDEVDDSRLSGRIYLAIDDEEKSYIAGRFTAEILQRLKKVTPARTNSVPTP
jgi:hypothetical protein